MDSLFGFYMKNWFKRAYFEVSTTSEKFHYISRDLDLVNLDHCAALFKALPQTPNFSCQKFSIGLVSFLPMKGYDLDPPTHIPFIPL